MKIAIRTIFLGVFSLCMIFDTLAQDNDRNDSKKDDDKGVEEVSNKTRRKRTRHSLNFDLGMNNYLTPEGSFPDANNEIYTIKPFGSWYFAVNSMTKVNVAGPLFFDFGGGLSWYNFKFQDTSTRILKGADRVEFIQDPNNFDNYIKSKLGVTYLQIQALPGFEFGSQFRFYAGMYAGYRIGSRSKLVYRDPRRNRDIDKNNYFITNIRYGVRSQIGIRGLDIFVNYDLNTLFQANRGPELHGLSFGVIF